MDDAKKDRIYQANTERTYIPYLYASEIGNQDPDSCLLGRMATDRGSDAGDTCAVLWNESMLVGYQHPAYPSPAARQVV